MKLVDQMAGDAEGGSRHLSTSLGLTGWVWTFPAPSACTFRLLTFWEADGRWLRIHSACLIGHVEVTEFAQWLSLTQTNNLNSKRTGSAAYWRSLTYHGSDLFLNNLQAFP